jgi:hypothetical protein
MLGTPGAVDAHNAPTALVEIAARFPQAPTPIFGVVERKEQEHPALARGHGLNDTQTTCRVAAFQTFLSSRI